MVDDDKLQKQGAEIELFYALYFCPFDKQPGAKIRTHNRSIESSHWATRELELLGKILTTHF